MDLHDSRGLPGPDGDPHNGTSKNEEEQKTRYRFPEKDAYDRYLEDMMIGEVCPNDQ